MRALLREHLLPGRAVDADGGHRHQNLRRAGKRCKHGRERARAFVSAPEDLPLPGRRPALADGCTGKVDDRVEPFEAGRVVHCDRRTGADAAAVVTNDSDNLVATGCKERGKRGPDEARRPRHGNPETPIGHGVPLKVVRETSVAKGKDALELGHGVPLAEHVPGCSEREAKVDRILELGRLPTNP